MADVRVLIGQKDGVELDVQTEYELLAEDVPYDNTDSTLDSTNVNDAIDELDAEKTSIIARAKREFIHNGSVSNNEWFGRSELIPSDETPLGIPWDCTLTEITFSNKDTSVEGQILLYINGVLAGTYTVNTGTKKTAYFYPSLSLNAEDELSAQWNDQGTNPSDASIDFDFILDS